jgi:hypothetical protein
MVEIEVTHPCKSINLAQQETGLVEQRRCEVISEEPSVDEHVEEGALRNKLAVVGLLMLGVCPQLRMMVRRYCTPIKFPNEVADKVDEKLPSRLPKLMFLVILRNEVADEVVVGSAKFYCSLVER